MEALPRSHEGDRVSILRAFKLQPTTPHASEPLSVLSTFGGINQLISPTPFCLQPAAHVEAPQAA